jgi:hypothetical protein
MQEAKCLKCAAREVGKRVKDALSARGWLDFAARVAGNAASCLSVRRPITQTSALVDGNSALDARRSSKQGHEERQTV